MDSPRKIALQQRLRLLRSTRSFADVARAVPSLADAARSAFQDYGDEQSEIDALEREVRDLEAERRPAARDAMSSTSRRTPPETKLAKGLQIASTVILHPDDVKILRALDREKATQSQYDLEHSTRLSRRTISKRLQVLRQGGLTCRPRGERGGETVTNAGRAALPQDTKQAAH
jgi:DNA-binding transcriptional ArsR family regulator